MPLTSGDFLHDRYRIERILGHGGMGAVYLATDESLGLPCAIKENLNLSPESERQFKREATLLASLRHPNLPRVTNHFVLGNQQYLVMDFVEGEDLKERLEAEGPLPEADVLRWGEQICAALIYLHNLAPPIIHRDIKPANIKITPAGEAMLVDFGIAKAGAGGQKTTTGAMGLTPGYAPPEQYGTGRTDARTDEYALAATLYHLFTGLQPPDSVERLLGNKTLTPLADLRPELTPHVAAALTCALAINPDERFADLAEFRAGLMGETPVTLPAPPLVPQTTQPQVESVAPAPAKPPAPRSARPRWLAPVGIGIVIGMLILALTGIPGLSSPGATATFAPTEIVLAATATTSPATSSTPAPVPPTATPTPTFTPTDTAAPTATPTSEAISVASASRVSLLHRWGRGRLLSAQWSPDGKFLAVNTSRGAYIHEGETLALVQELEGASFLVFGPDHQIVLRDAIEAKVVDWEAGQVLKTLGQYEVVSAAFSPDGKTLALGGRVTSTGHVSGLALLSLADDSLHVLDEGKQADLAVAALAFTPTGETLLASLADFYSLGYIAREGRRPAYTSIAIWDVASGRRLRPPVESVSPAMLSADGKWLAYLSDQLVIENLLTGGVMRQIKADGSPYFPSSRTVMPYSPIGFNFAPDSKQLVVFYEKTEFESPVSHVWATVAEWGVNGGAPQVLFKDWVDIDPGRAWGNSEATGAYGNPERFELSPTGTHFFSITSDGVLRLWDFGTGQVIAADEPYYTGKSAVLSPDGHQVAVPNVLGVDIYDPQAGKVVDQLRSFLNPYEIQGVVYMADMLMVAKRTKIELWDTKTHTIARNYDISGLPVVSPDGSLFALRDKYLTIYEMDSGQPRHVLGSPSTRGNDFRFTADGKYLLLASGQAVGLWNTETGERERNLVGSGTEIGVLALTPDGARLVSSTGDVWDMDTFQLITTFGGSSAPGPVAISPDGRVIATSDGALWDADSGQQLDTLPGIRGPATYLAFTPDGQRLIWQTEDGVIDVWGVKT